MKITVVTIPGMLFEADIAELKKLGEVNYVERNDVTEDALAQISDGSEVLMLNFDVVVNGCGELSAEFWSRPELSNLRSVSFDMTGIDWASPQAAKEKGITLQNIPHYSTQSVAESVLAEILIHSRQRHMAYVDEIKGRDVVGRKGINLNGRTIGIIGLGSIGSKVAELARGFNMSVIAWNRTPRPGIEMASIPEVFERSDVAVIALKTVKTGKDANTGIVGQEALQRARGVIVINLANRALVDEDAMASALKSGAVAAYSLDRNPDSLAGPLGSLENVHFPPANAWNSDESMDTLRATWVSNVASFCAGQPENVYTD
jgi:glycerate dehydrogenase